METNMGDVECPLMIEPPERREQEQVGSRHQPPKRREHLDLQKKLLKKFLELLNTPNEDRTLEEFKKLLDGHELKRLQEIYSSRMENEHASGNIPERKSFLSRTCLQEVLAKMLDKIETYFEFLQLFIERFDAYNECIEPQYVTSKNTRSSNSTQSIVRELDSPLHCAVRQLDEKFFDWLLQAQRLEVNLRNKGKETALALLCLSYDEFKQRVKQTAISTSDRQPNIVEDGLETVKRFILKLLAHGADFNIYTCVPLAFDLLWKYYEKDDGFVDDIIKANPRAIAMSWSTKRSSNGEPGNEVKGNDQAIKNADGKAYKATKRSARLLNETADNVHATLELLEIFLRFNDADQFEKYWSKFEVTDENAKHVIRLLLHTAVDQARTTYVRHIIDKAGKVIFKHDEDNQMDHRVELKGLLKKPCLKGDPYLLKIILTHICDRLLLNEVPLLVATVNKARRAKNASETSDLLDCAKVLIEYREKVPIYASGSDGNTALHLALKFGYDKLALLMLEKQYGLLGLRNRQNQTPVDCGTLQFWESYLDNCITSNRPVIKLNVGFLRPMEKEKPTHVVQGSGCTPSRWPEGCKFLKLVKDGRNSKCQFAETVNEMTALRLIAESEERKELLLHPTLISFIMMKWRRLCHWNLLNLCLTILTMVCFGAYTLSACSLDGGTMSSWLLGSLSAIGALIMLFRECTQWLLLGESYATVENIVDMLTIVLMGVILPFKCGLFVPICSSFVIVSLALQSSFLFGALFEELATFMCMFKTVSKNFLYSFLVFTPLIGSFVFGFYLTNNVPQSDLIDSCSSDDCAQENFNNFRSFWNATIKTLVMTTGEFEAANANFDDGKVLLFIGFLFLAPIVILNLINGLAVSDIAAIREESKLFSICKKVKQLEQYERGIVKRLTFSGAARTAADYYVHKMIMWILKATFPVFHSFFEKHEPTLFIVTNELNKLGLVTKAAPANENSNTCANALKCWPKKNIEKDCNRTKNKSNIKAIPIVPCLSESAVEWYFNYRSCQMPLFVTLDDSYVNQAIKIVGKRNAESPTEESLDLADTELAVISTPKKKAHIKRQKPSSDNATPAGPANKPLDPAHMKQTVPKKAANGHQRSSVPTTDPRDMQIKQLQEQLNTVVQIMDSIKQELQTIRSFIREDQQLVEDRADNPPAKRK